MRPSNSRVGACRVQSHLLFCSMNPSRPSDNSNENQGRTCGQRPPPACHHLHISCLLCTLRVIVFSLVQTLNPAGTRPRLHGLSVRTARELVRGAMEVNASQKRGAMRLCRATVSAAANTLLWTTDAALVMPTDNVVLNKPSIGV